MQQGVDEAVLLDAIEPAVIHTGQQALHLFQQRVESLRLVAPGLAQQVGDQRVADDAPRERVLVGGLLPAGRQVPVVGDVMVVEDHQRRHVRQRPRHPRQALAELQQAALFAAIALGVL